MISFEIYNLKKEETITPFKSVYGVNSLPYPKNKTMDSSIISTTSLKTSPRRDGKLRSGGKQAALKMIDLKSSQHGTSNRNSEIINTNRNSVVVLSKNGPF